MVASIDRLCYSISIKGISIQTRKRVIRRIAVRGNGVSSHHGGSIEGAPETPPTVTALSNRGVEGAPLIGPSSCREKLVYGVPDRVSETAIFVRSFARISETK